MAENGRFSFNSNFDKIELEGNEQQKIKFNNKKEKNEPELGMKVKRKRGMSINK